MDYNARIFPYIICDKFEVHNMRDKEKNLENQVEETKPAKPETDDWYTLALQDMEDFIEEQGIYIRQ